MFMVTVFYTEQNYEGKYASDWESKESVALFSSRNDAVDYIKALKCEYHAKGVCSAGIIFGKKTVTDGNRRSVKHIRTELNEIAFGETVDVSFSSDVGEYGEE